MSVIKKIQIKKVEVFGFKGFKDSFTFEFNETGRNIIVGDNGQGKTSIGESIVWAITGKNISGNVKEINVLNNKSKIAKVTINFIDENGKDHVLERSLNPATTIKLDKVQLTQEKLKNFIAIDLFLMIFNPMYYISLDSLNARKAIYPLFPNITKNDILARISQEDKELLEKEGFDETKTNDYLKGKRKELNGITDALKFLEGYIEKLQEPVIIPDAVTFDDNKIIELEKQIKDLREKKPVLINLEELLMKKAEFDKQIFEIKNEKFESEKIIAELKSKKALLMQELKNEESKEYKSKDISEFEKKLSEFRSDYKITLAENKILQDEKKKLDEKKIQFNEGDICPTCKQLISKHGVETLNAELQKEIATEKSKINEQVTAKAKSLEDLEKEGKELVTQISKAKELNDKAKIEFEKAKTNKIASLKNEIATIEKELENIGISEKKFMVEKDNKIKPIIEKINELKINELKVENDKIKKEFSDEISKKIVELETPLLTLKKEKEVAMAKVANRENLLKIQEKNKKELIEKHKEITALKNNEKLINSKIIAMKSFNMQKSSAINDVISKHLKRASIKFEKTVESTGEIKDTFEVLYDDKELKICSNSEITKTGIEISEMISALSGYEAPMLVDNGESITKYDTTITQVIETRVMENKKLSMLSQGGNLIEFKSTPVVNTKEVKSKTAV